MFHPFLDDYLGILPQKFTYPFCYQPHTLTLKATAQVMSYISQQSQLSDELYKGKMFGVLVVKNSSGKLGFIAAFSGRIADSYIHDYFVPPIYDLKDKKGFFLKEEEEISFLNKEIQNKKNDFHFNELKDRKSLLEKEFQIFLNTRQEELLLAKNRRAVLRNSELSHQQEADLIKESQFQKAQFKRDKELWKIRLNDLEEEVNKLESEIINLQEKRKSMSAHLQQKLFEQFELLNALGEKKNLCEIFSDYGSLVPPGGSGECAAPKMLQYAYLNGYTPISMGEFWYGNSPKGIIRKHGNFYPSCTSKCGPILAFMLQGLEVEENPLSKCENWYDRVKVLYEDDDLLALDKPAGVLSVPGKDSTNSLYDYVISNWSNLSGPLVVHRLDMATSGVLIFAKNKQSHCNLQAQFKNRSVKKSYLALLDGRIEQDGGDIRLPLASDYGNRPCQKVDYKNGKPSYTSYKVIERGENMTKVEFYPHTGRTHQLRVHAAHHEGLNCPIKGDTLYGTPSDRLYLHAQTISFQHPVTGDTLTISSPAEF